MGLTGPSQKASGTAVTEPDRPKSQGNLHLSSRTREQVLLPRRRWICLITPQFEVSPPCSLVCPLGRNDPLKSLPFSPFPTRSSWDLSCHRNISQKQIVAWVMLVTQDAREHTTMFLCGKIEKCLAWFPRSPLTMRVIWGGCLTSLSLDSPLYKMRGTIFTSNNHHDDFLRKSD